MPRSAVQRLCPEEKDGRVLQSELVLFLTFRGDVNIIPSVSLTFSGGGSLAAALQCGTQASLLKIMKIINDVRSSKFLILVARYFFLFGPGRARREQPIGGLGFGVRAFVRSVSHAKVLVARLFWLFGSLRSTLLLWLLLHSSLKMPKQLERKKTAELVRVGRGRGRSRCTRRRVTSSENTAPFRDRNRRKHRTSNPTSAVELVIAHTSTKKWRCTKMMITDIQAKRRHFSWAAVLCRELIVMYPAIFTSAACRRAGESRAGVG